MIPHIEARVGQKTGKLFEDFAAGIPVEDIAFRPPLWSTIELLHVCQRLWQTNQELYAQVDFRAEPDRGESATAQLKKAGKRK